MVGREYKHSCGCITKEIEKVINFVNMCDEHKLDGKFVWIALQHPKDLK